MGVLLFSLLTANLFFGVSGPHVLTLQQVLNRDPDTRITNTGLGSPGNETDYFGSLTRAAVIRFQEKYASEVLTPAGLSRGNGYVGYYTRMKLNTLITDSKSTEGESFLVPPAISTPSSSNEPSIQSDFLVKESEKIDVYAGDKMIAAVREKIYSAINSGVASGATEISPPSITTAEVPSVAIGELSQRTGVPGTRVTVTGTGISLTSTVYFGNTYIVRTVNKDFFGNFFFVVPPIPPMRYDIAVRTGNVISNTAIFVIKDAKNPFVHVQSISPATISYGGTLTITGSGFTPKNNVVVTNFQTFAEVPSTDGTTLSVTIAPESMRESAKIGPGTYAIPMSAYVVNDYGFSDSEKTFTMTL